jgi:hypothetical protein
LSRLFPSILTFDREFLSTSLSTDRAFSPRRRQRLAVRRPQVRQRHERIRPAFFTDRNAFGFEMTLHVLKRKIPYIEIPVNYRPRVGTSAVTGSLWKTATLALRMLWMIVQFRLLGKGQHPPADAA